MEAQQAEAQVTSQTVHAKLSAEEAAKVREKESLRLARQRVLQQLAVSANPRHRQLMEEALAELDAKLSRL